MHSHVAPGSKHPGYLGQAGIIGIIGIIGIMGIPR